MTPKIRSFSGAALMLVVIPIFVGLLACMPVPVGNPVSYTHLTLPTMIIRCSCRWWGGG